MFNSLQSVNFVIGPKEYLRLSDFKLEQTMLSRVTAAALLMTLKSANALLLPDDVVCLHSSRVTRPFISPFIWCLQKSRVNNNPQKIGKITSSRLELMERLRVQCR